MSPILKGLVHLGVEGVLSKAVVHLLGGFHVGGHVIGGGIFDHNALFLHDPKGHFLRIHTSGALTLAIDHKSAVMPQTVTVPWVEIGSAADAHLILYPGGDFYPTDKIILTTVSVNPKTGMLLWDVPDDYLDETTTLSLSGGILSADRDGPFTPAELEIDAQKKLIAEVAD